MGVSFDIVNPICSTSSLENARHCLHTQDEFLHDSNTRVEQTSLAFPVHSSLRIDSRG